MVLNQAILNSGHEWPEGWHLHFHEDSAISFHDNRRGTCCSARSVLPALEKGSWINKGAEPLLCQLKEANLVSASKSALRIRHGAPRGHILAWTSPRWPWMQKSH
jgi:hypothetical protein